MIATRICTDATELQACVAETIAAQLEEALAKRGTALLGLSGGSTPLPIYRALAVMPIDWPRVHMALVDERWVGLEDVASNERALRQALAPALTRGAHLVGMYNGAPHACDGVAACGNAYRSLPLPFDAVVLGMGTDGHFASLFPGAEGLQEALDPTGERLCMAIRARPGSATAGCEERMSLTLAGIANSRAVELLLTGSAKLQVFEHARLPCDPLLMPLHALLTLPGISLRAWWAP